jgi:hypothetical protein
VLKFVRSSILALIVLVAVYACAIKLATPGTSVAAQGSGFWKVVAVSPDSQGAMKLEQALNDNAGGPWELHSLHLSHIQGAPAFAVLKRR